VGYVARQPLASLTGHLTLVWHEFLIR
jgi:hypothetical protein